MKKITTLICAVLLILSSAAVHAEGTFPLKHAEIGKMKISSTRDLRNISALKSDGTITIRNFDKTDDYTDIADIASMYDDTAVLHSDGSVSTIPLVYNSVLHNCTHNEETWGDIVQLCSGIFHFAGLRSDGTVVATGRNENGQCDVDDWCNVIKIYAGECYTAGVRADGRVYFAGDIKNADKVRSWSGVSKIIEISELDFVGLKTDGTLISTFEKLPEVSIDVDGFGKITDIASTLGTPGGWWPSFDSMSFYALDENGMLVQTFIEQISHEYTQKTNILQKNINHFQNVLEGYIAVANNGQIFSDAVSLTSGKWILTTNVTYKGAYIATDVAPYISDGRTLAPLRAICEVLGAAVSWDADTQTVTITKGADTISLVIGSDTASVNGAPMQLDASAQITRGRTFVPVRFIAESFNLNVTWDDFTRTVVIE